MSLELVVLLKCLFSNDIECEFVTSSTFGMMDRCLSCDYYLRAMREMELQDDAIMNDIDVELGCPVSDSLPVVKPVDHSYAQRLALNHQISENPYWRLPVVNDGFEDFMPVGRGGRPSSDFCGKPRGLSRCDNVEGHEGVVIKGVDYTGMDAVSLNHFWCTNPSCPVCFIRGWSVRGSRRMEGRLAEAVRLGYGKVEHMTVSPPYADWHRFPAWFLIEKCQKALVVRDVLGGGRILHVFRIDESKRFLKVGFHLHVLGFIKGGYDRCRECGVMPSIENCRGCDGFEARTRKYNASDGCIVRVFGERLSVGATAYYQLNHASIHVGIKRFHTVTWVGCCGNRKFKAVPVKAKTLCHVCAVHGLESEPKRSVWVGKNPLVKNIASPAYRAKLALPAFGADGSSNFVDVDADREDL